MCSSDLKNIIIKYAFYKRTLLCYIISGDNSMDLLQKILECSEEEVDSIIDSVIVDANKNATKVEKLGFLNYGKSYSVFKGFIPLKTRIKYSNLNIEDYGMESTDFIYEFAHFVRKYNINSKSALIYSLEYFVNLYFGYPGGVDRETIFNDIAWQTTTTDEEYFAALEKNKLGDLKGKGAAECTERGALVQQILSIFGTESYYCMGCVDLGDRQEGHCFNVVKRRNDYALVDYSLPVESYNSDGSFRMYCPFVGILSNEEFLEFVNNGVIKAFDCYDIRGGKQEKKGMQRRYVVGEYEFEDQKQASNHM